MKKIKKAIESVDEMIKLSKDKVILLNKLKLGLYIKMLKPGNTSVLVQKFKDYCNTSIHEIYHQYIIDKKLLHSLLKSIDEPVYEKYKWNALRYVPEDTYIIIGNKNQSYLLIDKLSMSKDKIVVKVE